MKEKTKNLTVDVTSDVHIDSWIGITIPEFRQEKLIHKLIKVSLPDEPSDVIIVAGDIGHYNKQNILFLKSLRKYYKKVLWVHGNHDMWIVSEKMAKKYNYDSFNKLNELIELSEKENGIHYLNGDTIEIDGHTIGGTAMWFNNDYAKKWWSKIKWTLWHDKAIIRKVWGESDETCLELYRYYMKDARLVVKDNKPLDYLEYFDEQKKLLEQIHKKCDVIITHVGPDWSVIRPIWYQPPTTFFWFDGKRFLNELKKDAMWVYGHTHDKHFYKHSSGCEMICNPFGYENSNPHWTENGIENKFMGFLVGEKPSYEDIFKDVK